MSTRISELRTGCTRLALAQHPALPEVDQRWLREVCRGWGIKLEKAVQEIEAGTDPLVIRADVDDLVQRVGQELRERAAG